ncbi:MAG: hypothetical protein JNN05_01940 [Candidatus Omnitrophica bacterium]|nr:hypothetical protein [Candidatus Omnitrophota bacterium]
MNLLGHYDRWSSDPSLQANDRKPIFDLKFTKNFDHAIRNVETQIYVNVYNLTNSKYWSSITYPLAPRHVEGGLVVKF